MASQNLVKKLLWQNTFRALKPSTPIVIVSYFYKTTPTDLRGQVIIIYFFIEYLSTFWDLIVYSAKLYLIEPLKNIFPADWLSLFFKKVMPHHKPRWLPVAPSKKFRLPPQDHIPEAEVEQILALHEKYRDRMAALTQYLWEDYLRNSDVGQAAILEAEREEAEHKELLKHNDEVRLICYFWFVGEGRVDLKTIVRSLNHLN